jgi:hypothetical protein
MPNQLPPLPVDSNLEHKLKVLAKSNNCDDFLAFMEDLIGEITDARNKFGKDDSLELRRFMADYIKSNIDRIKRIRDNQNNKPGDEPVDEDY